MNTDKNEELTIWAAIGPNGQLVKSSVGTFKSVAARWALRRGNSEVVKLGTIAAPNAEIKKEEAPVGNKRTRAAAASRENIRREPKKLGTVGRPRRSKSAMATEQETNGNQSEGAATPDKLEVDRGFFGRSKRRA